MFGQYKRSLDEAAGLTTLFTMVLLDDSTYNAQRNALIDFAKVTPAKNADELALATHNAMCDLAYKMWKETPIPLGAPGFLSKAREWKITRR
jgi:hypothetical protein